MKQHVQYTWGFSMNSVCDQVTSWEERGAFASLVCVAGVRGAGQGAGGGGQQLRHAQQHAVVGQDAGGQGHFLSSWRPTSPWHLMFRACDDPLYTHRRARGKHRGWDRQGKLYLKHWACSTSLALEITPWWQRASPPLFRLFRNSSSPRCVLVCLGQEDAATAAGHLLGLGASAGAPTFLPRPSLPAVGLSLLEIGAKPVATGASHPMGLVCRVLPCLPPSVGAAASPTRCPAHVSPQGPAPPPANPSLLMLQIHLLRRDGEKNAPQSLYTHCKEGLNYTTSLAWYPTNVKTFIYR